MVASTGIAGAGRRFLLRDAIFALTRPRRAFVVRFLLVVLTDLFAFLGAARLAALFRGVLPRFDVALRAATRFFRLAIAVPSCGAEELGLGIQSSHFATKY
jgi:hypothetical protein